MKFKYGDLVKVKREFYGHYVFKIVGKWDSLDRYDLKDEREPTVLLISVDEHELEKVE